MSLLRSFACFALVMLAFQACEQKEEPVTPPAVISVTTKYFYTLTVTDGKPIDTTMGQYVLWFHWRGDSSYRLSVPLHFWVRSGGNLTFSGSVVLDAPDSVDRERLSRKK